MGGVACGCLGFFVGFFLGGGGFGVGGGGGGGNQTQHSWTTTTFACGCDTCRSGTQHKQNTLDLGLLQGFEKKRKQNKQTKAVKRSSFHRMEIGKMIFLTVWLALRTDQLNTTQAYIYDTPLFVFLAPRHSSCQPRMGT